MKKILIGIVIGGLIFGSLSVAAAYTFFSKQVTYVPTDSSWKVENVEDALNDLYLTTNNNKVYTYSVPISFGNSTGGSQPSSTVNLTNIPNYDKLTVEKNIFIKSFTYGSKWNDNGPSESYSPVLSYDSSTGIVTINNLGRGNLSTYGWVVTSMILAVVA